MRSLRTYPGAALDTEPLVVYSDDTKDSSDAFVVFVM